MKFQVQVKTLTNETVSLELTASPDDLVQTIKENIVSAVPNPFPDQMLLCDKKELCGSKRLSDYGVQDGSRLEFAAKPSEQAMLHQLEELLRPAPQMSIEELGLMYSLKHGVSAGDALQGLGKGLTLRHLLESGKRFSVQGDRVALSAPAVAKTPAPEQASGLLPRPPSLPTFMATGSEQELAQKLADVLRAQGPLSVAGLDNAYCLRHGASATHAVQMLGWGEKLSAFVARCPLFSGKQGGVALSEAPPIQSPSSQENDALVELAAKLCDAAFSDEVAGALDDLVETVLAQSFLNITYVVKGGAVGKGVAIPGAANAEVVAFLDGLPSVGHETYLPSLARALAGALREQFQGPGEVLEVSAVGDAVHLRVNGPLEEVKLFLSPDFGSYAEAVDALCSEGQKARPSCAAALMERRVRFVEKQPPGIKAAIRLTKWWRDQRQWSSANARPSDELLEAVVVHTLRARAPEDLRAAVARTLEALSHFDVMELTWPLGLRGYREADVPRSVRAERPLVLDPADPGANLANLEGFQPAEMMRHAQSGKFF